MDEARPVCGMASRTIRTLRALPTADEVSATISLQPSGRGGDGGTSGRAAFKTCAAKETTLKEDDYFAPQLPTGKATGGPRRPNLYACLTVAGRTQCMDSTQRIHDNASD
eukprot:TRINITY_DN15770_c0_g2_i2.p1 TRINITY_DN15770_c0_g2~~TRINITY_DN15770_c0_g2_i2.p1  ORF type:complete len:110 (+),score=14.57 TRINITY_DN15770_c0_g2_i2:81-410(+)